METKGCLAMRLNDLAIFIEVAKAPSLREAANRLDLQPGTASKVIKRIEAHYQQQLFARQGGNWSLTPAGEMLFQRAIELVTINDKIERELGKPRRPHLRLSGSEAILGYFVPSLIQRLLDKQHDATIETKTSQDLSLLHKYEVDIALVSSLSNQLPEERDINASPLSRASFVTVASKHHPLFENKHDVIPIDELLEYAFVIPSRPIYGSMAAHRSLDGWHDEAFNRRIAARVDTISTLTALVKHQPLLAYLPDYVAKEHELEVINVSGCPYSCEQTIWLCHHTKVDHHWMQVFQ
ncbi:LysR family transcriptional regulator [Vibrio sp. B1FLJ16]|nr:LysR family transcriptional regulator [Vibrio sp. B1FLJ16]